VCVCVSVRVFESVCVHVFESVLMPIQAAAESAPVCLAASDSASSCGGWSSAALGL